MSQLSDALRVLLFSSDKLSLVFACCVELLRRSVFILKELAFSRASGSNLTFVENGIFADGVGVAVRDELSNRVNKEDSEGDTKRECPLLPGEGNDLENETGEGDDEDLENEDDAPDKQENGI